MDLKHFLKLDHITVLIALILLVLNLYFNERILTLVILLLIVFATVYDVYEEF